MPVNPVRLDVNLAARTGANKPVHGVSFGPISNCGWTDNSNLFKEMAFPYARLHDCPADVAETVDVHSILSLFHLDENDSTMNLCVAAPALCRLTLEPADDVRGDR